MGVENEALSIHLTGIIYSDLGARYIDQRALQRRQRLAKHEVARPVIPAPVRAWDGSWFGAVTNVWPHTNARLQRRYGTPVGIEVAFTTTGG